MNTAIFTKFSIVALAAFIGASIPAEAHSRKDKRDRYDHRYEQRHHHRQDRRANRWHFFNRPVVVTPAPVVVSRPVVVNRPVYNSTEREVQRELARRGYYRGVVDGQIGPQTRASIRAYQIDRGLPVTGHIDRRLLRSLRLV